MATSTTVDVPGTSNVLDAAAFKASQLNVTLSDGAKDAIMKRVSGPLEILEKKRTLAPYAEDIQKNTYTFIEYVFQTQLDGRPGSTITIDHISNALSSYCQKHKNQLPFCR
jgi:hypothetical protein